MKLKIENVTKYRQNTDKIENVTKYRQNTDKIQTKSKMWQNTDKIQTKSKMWQNKDKIENATKSRQKTVQISFMCGCKYVSVCECGGMCVRVDACFKLSQARNVKRWLYREWVTNVYTFVAIYSFVDNGKNCHRCKLWGMSENLICKGIYIYI